MKTRIKVQGSCGMCKTRIEKAAMSVESVSSATWDLQKKELEFEFNHQLTNQYIISKMVAQAGHDTESDKAPDVTYDTLPACCKYRK
ncbi:MAG: cation transporter [Tannerella sp.]|jgi:Cu(I)/Ag(I) efflux system membrane fusion protein|nr:cation transporter [Tannerella sp.]